MSKAVTLNLDDEAAGILAKLKRQSGLENEGEVLTFALSLFSRVMDARESGMPLVWCLNEAQNVRAELTISFPPVSK